MSVFFIGTAHDEYRRKRFPEGSVVIDPWRMIPDQPGVTVRRLGENRPAMISILVPSRGRPAEFLRMVKSAYDTATYVRRIEVIARVDEDDEDKFMYPVGPRYVTGPRILLSECWNECYAQASGEILMHAGDDITFDTPGWDQRVREEFAKLPDRIGLVYADDCSPNFPDLATHGFLHRRWVEAVGYFLPPLFSSDWNDVWISEVAKKVGRFIPMPDVKIEHHHYYFGKAEHDRTYREREERGERDQVVVLFENTKQARVQDARKLRAVMA